MFGKNSCLCISSIIWKKYIWILIHSSWCNFQFSRQSRLDKTVTEPIATDLDSIIPSHVKEDSTEWRRVVCSRDSCGGPHGVSESYLGYRCSRCDRRYSVQYSLERHQRYECGVEKQFSCGTCRRRFTRVDIMRSHQKRTGHRLTPYTRLVKVSPLDRHVSATEVFPREYENESHQQQQQQQRQRRGRGGINNSSMSICRSWIFFPPFVISISLLTFRTEPESRNHAVMPSFF